MRKVALAKLGIDGLSCIETGTGKFTDALTKLRPRYRLLGEKHLDEIEALASDPGSREMLLGMFEPEEGALFFVSIPSDLAEGKSVQALIVRESGSTRLPMYAGLSDTYALVEKITT